MDVVLDWLLSWKLVGFRQKSWQGICGREIDVEKRLVRGDFKLQSGYFETLIAIKLV